MIRKLILTIAMLATPVAAAPSAPVTHAGPTGPLFGANLSGAEARGGDAVRPSLDDWKGYI